MKKILALSLLTLVFTGSFVSARTIYDSTGRHIIQDGTIRGQKRAAQERLEQQRKMKAAAAAKLNYEEALKSLETPQQTLKSNYINAKEEQK
jgi:hypothetical protein